MMGVMKEHFKERNTRDYHQKRLFTKEELEERESLCVHEQPPFCSAACPMKLDVRDFVRRMAAKDFTGARAMLERISPFPEILAHGCSHPCEAACRMGEAGESIAIADLERVAMFLGAPKKGKGLLKFKKKKRAAVFGGELFTLVVAAQLADKSYPVEFYVEAGDAESLLKQCAPFLSEEILASAVRRLQSMDMKIFYGTDLSSAFVEEKRGAFDLLCAAGYLAKESPDADTLLGKDGILYPSEEGGECLRAFYDARRASVSADRLAQGLDPSTMRGEEGTVTSRLYTNMGQVEPSKRIPLRGEGEAYDGEKAAEEAVRCIQCVCEECLKGCTYLRHFAKHPRILTREIYNNTGIIMGDHMMNKAMNSCSLCGQCAVTCPNGYDMGEICRLARENMVDTGKMSLAVHEFALQDMLFSNTEGFLSCVPKGQEQGCRYVFFPGCQAGAVAPEAVLRAYRDLAGRLDGGVALMLGCCGAIAKWAGRRELLNEQKDFLRQEFGKLGSPVILAACPTCRKTLEEEGLGQVKSLWETLLEIDLPEGSACHEEKVVLHDACGARNDQKMRQDVREIAGRLGFRLLPAEWEGEKTSCCGYGGLVAYANREMAAEMAEDCRKEFPDAPYITYCMACRDRLARQGAQSMHLLELLYECPAGTPPDISEKRRNRLLLRETILREFGGGDDMSPAGNGCASPEEMGFRAVITEEARRQMDDRMILDTDVWKVMGHYRDTGEAVLDQRTGLLIARLRIGNVTFWVKFTEDGAGYIIRGAYSHRMLVRTR